MITTVITAVIAAILTFFGIKPGPYVAGVWIAVKIALVVGLMALGARSMRRKQKSEAPPAGPSEP